MQLDKDGQIAFFDRPFFKVFHEEFNLNIRDIVDALIDSRDRCAELESQLAQQERELNMNIKNLESALEQKERETSQRLPYRGRL